MLPEAIAAESVSAPESLPDLGARDASRLAAPFLVTANPAGVKLEGRQDGRLFALAPEYSNQTGFNVGATFASLLRDGAALGALVTAGANKKELLLNAGFQLDAAQRVILSAGQLRQSLDFAFASGNDKAEMIQNSGGFSYQLQLGQGVLQSLDLNGYLATTASRDLGAKTYAIDTATVFELWNDPRRIAGGRVSGVQGRLGFSPFAGSLVKLSFGSERLSYELLAGRDTVNRATGGVEWLQDLTGGFRFKAGAETFSARNRYTLGLEKSLSGADGRHNVGVSFTGSRGRDGLGDENQVQLTYRYAFGAGGGARMVGMNSDPRSAAVGRDSSRQADEDAGRVSTRQSLLDRVAERPNFMPSQVVARLDTTAAAQRRVVVDKTGVPAGASIAPATGAITVPLGVAVSGIAGVTLNGGAFANA